MQEKSENKVISEALADNVSYNHRYIQSALPENFVYHTHDRCEIIFLIRGSMRYVAEGRSYNLETGDLILTRPSVFHSIFPRVETCYERYDAIIDESGISQGIFERIPKNQDVFKCAANERIYELFSKLDAYYGRFSDAEYAHITYNILEEVFYNLASFEIAALQGAVNPLIDKATAYISRHLTEISGIEELSDALYVTKSHLHHVFIKNLHMTPAKYILSKRLLKANGKILCGGRPTEIYTECGFDDYATFFRNYKRYFGYPPSETKHTEITRKIL